MEHFCLRLLFLCQSSEPSISSEATYPWRVGAATSHRPPWPSAWVRPCRPCAAWKRAICVSPFVSLRALHVFGEIQALEHLLDTPNDEIGLALMDERLPKRVRSKSGVASGAL